MLGLSWPELIAGGIVAMALENLVIFIHAWWESRQSEWHGVWYEVLPSFQGLPERWDIVRIKQHGHRLTGRAKRVTPLDERKRKWGFEGYVSGDRMIGFFYLKNRKIDPSSFTPVIMARDVHSRHEAIWRGIYYRPQYASENDIFSGEIESGSMWWQRSNPAVKYFGKPFADGSQQIRMTPSIGEPPSRH